MVRSQVQKFMSEIRRIYPNLYVAYDYDEENDQYEIWHNDPKLEFEDDEFQTIVGKLVDQFLFKNDIYNFYFGYDHKKAKSLKELEYNFCINKMKYEVKIVENLDNHLIRYRNRSNGLKRSKSTKLTGFSVGLEVNNNQVKQTISKDNMLKKNKLNNWNVVYKNPNIKELELAS